MRVSAYLLMIAVGVVAVAGAAKAQSMATPLYEAARARDQSNVGKDFWLKGTASICGEPVFVRDQCKELVNGTHLKIDGIAQGYVQGAFTRTMTMYDFYHVVVDDGRQGYINAEQINFHVTEVDPVAGAAECKRRGEPRIGMTVKQLEATCWGKPGHINRRTTAKGTRDQYVYGSGRHVDVVSGVVTSIDMGSMRERAQR